MARHACNGGAVVAMVCMLSSIGAGGRVAQAQGQTVAQLEAAVVMTLTRFVEWSSDEFPSLSAPIVIGIVGDEAVAVALETHSRGKNVSGRPISVTRQQWDSDLAGVHMLFVGKVEKRHLGVVLDRARSRPIVTVSSLPEFGRAGGMITLWFSDGRVSFTINSHATAASAVHLSAFLLSHATKVSDESSGRRK